jgi:hypothetical protein
MVEVWILLIQADFFGNCGILRPAEDLERWVFK